mgnify:CR=1 FL=1
MHKVQSPEKMKKVVYKAKPDGVADVWLRSNQREIVPETEDSPGGYEADEIFCQVEAAAISEKEITDDFEFWFSMLEEIPDFDANELGIEARRAAKLSEISSACQETIFSGVDVELNGKIHHFSLTVFDQLDLFGKKDQLDSGETKKYEYHSDGNPCKFYTEEEMKPVVIAAAKYISYHKTYCNSMYTWIRNCTKASEIEAIQYGAEIPEEYQSEVLQDYLARKATV